MGGSASAVAVDVPGNVYTVGSFAGTADFDPGAGVFNLTSAGGTDVFVSKLDSDGNFLWAGAMGGSSVLSFVCCDFASGVALDSAGNVYTVGNFRGTADFDPGAGVFNLTAASLARNAFISKLDSDGNFVWARAMDGSGNLATDVALDAAGNVYSVGSFVEVDLDPGPGIFHLTATGTRDAFVSKLDSGRQLRLGRSHAGCWSWFSVSASCGVEQYRLYPQRRRL